MMASTMIWHRSGSAWWVSDCSRYEVRKVRWPQGMNAQIYYYGRSCHVQMVEAFGDEIPTSVREWCEEHRRRVLPEIIAFESWVAERYFGRGGQFPALGPYGRRDMLRKTIVERGEWRLALKNEARGISMTLGEIYADLYQNGVPDHHIPEIHENGDGV